MNKRSSFPTISICAALLAAATLLAAPTEHALAQDVNRQNAERQSPGAARSPQADSPLDAPVRGGDPTLPEISFLRAAIHPVGIDPGVRVALDVHLSLRTVPDTLFFPTADLRVDSVRVNGRTVAPSTDLTRLAVPVPPNPDSTFSGDLRVTLFYAVQSGLNRRSDDKGAFAVWTAPGGFDAHWLPLPSASDDLFHADLAVILPGDWVLIRPSAPDGEESEETRQGPPPSDLDAPRIHLIRPEQAVTAHDLGFAAVRSDMLRSEATLSASAGDVRVVGRGILDRPADSVRTELEQAADFLDTTLSLSLTRDASVHVLVGGSPGGRVEAEVVIHGDAWPAPDAPWLSDFERSESAIHALIGSSLTRIPVTDAWLRPAIVAWLSARHVRSVHGEAAFADVMESLGDAYLAETRNYLRPLVWDRWTSPVDLLDAHARGKGAWVLHMIEALVGREALLAGLDAFLDLPDDRMRDSEAFRESVEEYSAENLSTFFDAWVYGAGHPVLMTSTSHDATREQLSVRVEQVQEGSLVPASFPMQVGVRFASIEGIRDESMIIDDPVATESFRASIEPTYFHLDTNADWLFEYRSPPSVDDLVSSLRDDDAPGSRVRTYRMLSRGKADSGLLFGARPIIAGETDPIARAVGLDLPAAMAPAASAERMLLEYVSDPSPLVRARAFHGLAAYETPAVGEAALRAANSDSNPQVLAAAVPVLIARRPAIAWDVVESALVTASPAHRVRLTALRRIALVDHADSERVSTLLDHTGPGQPFAIRRTAAIEAAREFPADSRVSHLAEQWLSAEEAILRLTALDMLLAMPVNAALKAAGGDAGAVRTDPDPRVRSRLRRLRAPSESD